MRAEVKDYLTRRLVENGIKISLRQCSDVEILSYLLLFKEGMELPDYIVSTFLNYARKVIDTKDITARINELKSGEINLDDFSNGKELAEYLENGVVL